MNGTIGWSSRFKIVTASYRCFITRFMYPSGVLSKICNEHSRHYSTIPFGSQTVLKNLTFLALHLITTVGCIYRPKWGNPINFCLWNRESGKQLKESGIPLTIGIQNPSSTDKDWNPVTGIRNPRRGIQNPRLSWIPLYMGRHIANVTSAVCRRKQDRSLL